MESLAPTSYWRTTGRYVHSGCCFNSAWKWVHKKQLEPNLRPETTASRLLTEESSFIFSGQMQSTQSTSMGGIKSVIICRFVIVAVGDYLTRQTIWKRLCHLLKRGISKGNSGWDIGACHRHLLTMKKPDKDPAEKTLSPVSLAALSFPPTHTLCEDSVIVLLMPLKPVFHLLQQ